MLISSNTSEILKKSIEQKQNTYCSKLFFSARWIVINQVSITNNNLNFIILPNKTEAEYCVADLYQITELDNVFFLPDSGKTIEYSNHKSSLLIQRTTTISKIIEYTKNKAQSPLFVVSYPQALLESIPSIHQLNEAKFEISVGDILSYDNLQEKLIKYNFSRVDFVSSPGQYAIRGALIDIFSYSYNLPYRISFFGDEVEKISIFETNTQLSKEDCEKVEICSSISEISPSTIFPEDTSEQDTQLYKANGDTSNYIHDILPTNDTIVWFDSAELYEKESFFSNFNTSDFKKVYLNIPQYQDSAKGEIVQFNISPQTVFNKNFEILNADIRKHILNNYKIYIYGEKQQQLDRLRNILSENNNTLNINFVSGKSIHEGFIDHENKICCYSEHQIFDRFHRVTLKLTVDKSEQLTLNELNALNIGDYIVHIEHGIGIFGGVVRIKDEKGRYKEVVKLIYKDNDIVFVAVHALNKIAKYRSGDGEIPNISKIGSKYWQALKNKTKSKVKDIAKELIQLYAKRKASKAFAFSADSYLQEELESSFIYEDTPDQESASLAVKRDMEQDCPMDRLICGDVGFGKTEIAIRAAFKAVLDNKQVVVLVPTTILAFQHYKTFSERLQKFPCTIDYVSRLRTAKEIKLIKQKISEGKIDIIIATHKILNKEFIFKDLGLLIVDEEQKFGVSVKEKLRQMKHSIDTLTLTATPIPRTLQFSLLGARDLSIINTAPPNRIPVQTEIILFNENEIKSILNYELSRGGQIFFLHNKINELQSIHDILHRLVPDMRICIAHGQMNVESLENQMLGFMEGEYDLLLSTTIIENGLDIPQANTIIINQAQNIGLSDLHQLRGRVGRSNKQAFCYLIVPPMTTINSDARKRLKAIEEFSDLGSGFNIAMQDLDIRGAGNLLGAQQSGFISEMGYETYQKILSEAISELGIEENTAANHPHRHMNYIKDCVIETDQAAFIPDEYLDITSEKIRIYRQLDLATNQKEVEREKNKIIDRFGKMPIELENLIKIVNIRNIGEKIGMEKIIIKNGMMLLFFISNPLSPYYKSDIFANILDKINHQNSIYNLKQNDNKLKIVLKNINTLEDAYNKLCYLQNE